ncbi:MAG: helix-turn-helix domain-containing protein [Pseudomonadales bacterium]|jgi:AraC-like DNA-binding protein|nr:helix-turn-helix domain-containing protein [Pseudomonadales bacterium]
MTSLALLLIGFSLFCALSLALTHFRAEHYEGQGLSRIMGLFLLLALSGLQLAHFAWLYLDWPWINGPAYRALLFAVAPAFFLYSQPLLRPQTRAAPWRVAAHLLPIIIAPALRAALALPLAFAVGALYLLWLAYSLYRLRRERANFRQELLLLGAVFAIALGVALLGLLQAALPGKLFFSLYAAAIGAAFFLVQTTLNQRPQLSSEISETARALYANSTLLNIDCAAALAQLERLMQTQRIFTDPDLNLSKLAAALALSTHQLSELINSRLGKSFSRYLREQRIAAAKTMLCAEPKASVLSVGLSVGFSTQSNFYEAFREIEGMTPGQYRRVRALDTRLHG